MQCCNGCSGAAMDAGYIGIYKDGSTKIALNANGDSYIDGGEFGIGITNGTGAAAMTTASAGPAVAFGDLVGSFVTKIHRKLSEKRIETVQETSLKKNR